MMTRFRGAITFLVFLMLLGIFAFMFGRDDKNTSSAYPQYRLPRGTLTIGTTTIPVFLAETNDAIVRGLSGLPALEHNRGMFFLFNDAAYHPFWMPDMLFPIDIVWIGDDWHIVDITTDVAPETYPQLFRPRLPARYVLEINSGKAIEWGLRVGAPVILERGNN